jgi:hypothetical protein
MKLIEVLMSIDQADRHPGAKINGRASDVSPGGDTPVPSGSSVQMTESPCTKGNPMQSDIPVSGGVRE